MNRKPVVTEISDDICLDLYMKSTHSVDSTERFNLVSTNEDSHLKSTHNADRESIVASKSQPVVVHLNGLIKRTKVTDDIPIRPFESIINTDQNYDPCSFSQQHEEIGQMDRHLNGGAQYRQYSPADDAGGESSDMLNSSSIGDDQLSRRRLVTGANMNNNNRDSDIDNGGPEGEDDDDDNDLSSVYQMRRQQRRQQRMRRRDTSASVCGDTASRRRPPISLSRSSTRVGQAIPPPPLEPPPSLPGGIDLSSQYAMYPVLRAGGFNLAAQPGIPPNMLQMADMPPNYITPGDQHLLQLQQAALIQQQQHQLHHRLLSANVAAMVDAGNPYLQGFATVGRPIRAGSLNQSQMTLLHPSHQTFADYGVMPSAAAIFHAQAAAAAASAQAPQSAGGSGSVVYENSYNSFQRLPPGSRVGQLTSDPSQDQLLPKGCPVPPPTTSTDADTTNINNNNNSTPSTMNGVVTSDNLAKSPSMPMSAVNAAMVNTPLMNYYDPSCGYMTHPPPVPPLSPGTMSTGLRDRKGSSATGIVGSGSRSRPFWRCSWQYWVILICVLAFLLAVSFAVFFSENAKWLENRLQEKYTQDPTVFGLFDPHSPPQLIEPDKPTKIHLESMKLWAGQWNVPGELCTIYNLTVTSELSSVGIFLRYATMPTIVHYNHFDRILGRQLKTDNVLKKGGGDLPREAFPSMPSGIAKANSARTSGRVRCLKKGHWFISLVNDQPRAEDIVLTMAEATMPRGCPNDCSNRGICSQGVCNCLNGLTGKDCSSLEETSICSGHGDYRQGKCLCFPEWKGPECEILWSECSDPNCSGHGRCVTGECLCSDGYGGDSCQFRTCASKNCTGNGMCADGVCRCFAGWSGDACDRPQKKDSSIGGIDFPGPPQGDAFSPLPPPEPACSLNGYRDPTSGSCRCSPGFEGTTCEKDVTCANRCVHGLCTGDHHRLLGGEVALPRLLSSTTLIGPAVCHCSDGWRGINCDVQTCHSKCLLNGKCINDACICNRGWTGDNCNLIECPLDCSGHGQCIKGAGNHYFCQCVPKRKGSACQASSETSCSDNLDNDEDGLIDCLDPDCCGNPHCENLIKQGNEDAKQSCAHSAELRGLILSTKVAPPGCTFYEQLEFLLLRERTTDQVDPRRASVVRGVVRQWDSTPFAGCRILDRLNPTIGSALTDKQGRFELVVDGGFLVQLELIRHPTSRFTAHLDVYVPANQIINIGDFYLIDQSASEGHKRPALSEGALVGTGGALPASPVFGDLWVAGLLPEKTPSASQTCPPDVHDINAFEGPIIDQNNQQREDIVVCLDREESFCVSEGVLSHRIGLKPSNTKLVYKSDRTENSASLLVINLLGRNRPPPTQLREVHLVIDVAGLRQIWRFEPSQGLEYTFAWNRTDGYNRTVYGSVPAKVSVGYLYSGCPTVYWENRIAEMHGHDIVSTDLGRWNVDTRHTFAPNQGIVYMGDGSRLTLKNDNLVVYLVLGKPNVKRNANRCEMCRGTAHGNPLFRVIDLSTDGTGRLLVGDGLFLRYLQPKDDRASADASGSYPSVFDLPLSDGIASDSSTPSQFLFDWVVTDAREMPFAGFPSGEFDSPTYFMARHPISAEDLEALSLGGIGGGRAGLFITDTRNKTIWWMSLVRKGSRRAIIGEGCRINDTECLHMVLTSPKGLVVTYNEDLFFIDGNRLWRYPLRRQMGQNTARVEILIGQSDETAGPLPCGKSLPATSVKLINPSALAYNPVEDSLYYIDDKHIFRLHLASRMVSLAAGRLPGCKAFSFQNTHDYDSGNAPLATDVEFPEVRGIAFSSRGELYIAESEVVWIRRSDGRLYRFAGQKTSAPWSQPTTATRLLHPPTSTVTSFSFGQSNFLSQQLAKGISVRDFRFGNITTMAVGIYDDVFVYDAGYNVVVSVRAEFPKLTENEKYVIRGKFSEEEYLFDKRGLIERVVDTLTQYPVKRFTFKGYGWLANIQEGASESTIVRDSHGAPQQFVLNTGEVYSMHARPQKNGAYAVVDPNGSTHRCQYGLGGEVVRFWMPANTSPYVVSYSPTNGQLQSLVSPSGSRLLHVSSTATKPHQDVLDVDKRSSAVSIESASNGKTIQLFYAARSQEALFERVDTPSVDNEDHTSWQIGRRIRVFLQDSKISLGNNNSSQGPRSIENLVVSSFDVFGLKSERDYVNLGRRKRYSNKLLSQPQASPFSLNRSPRNSGNTQKTRKTLSVNGQPMLSVTLNRELRTEIFRSPVTDRLLLQVSYNSNMQPVQFATAPSQADTPSGFADMGAAPQTPSELPNPRHHLAPLRLLYTRDGQLKEAFWGQANFRLSYDSKKRLRTAELGSTMDTLAFDYQSQSFPNLPTEVSVGGSGTYRLIYKNIDSESNIGSSLSHVITPSGVYRVFSRFVSVGVKSLTIAPWALKAGPTSSNPGAFTYDWETRVPASNTDSSGQSLARFTWPSGRRLNVLRTKRLIVYDNTIVHWEDRGVTDARFVSLRDLMAEFQIEEKRFFGAGKLVTQVRGDLVLAGTKSVCPEIHGLLAYKYEYEYDHDFKPSTIRSCLLKPKEDVPLWCHSHHLTYHNWAGYSISPLSVNVFDENLLTTITWTQGALRTRRQLDGHGRLVSVILEEEPQRGELIFNATFEYNGACRYPSEVSIETRGGVPRTTNYRRGPAGRVEGIDYVEMGSSRRQHVQVFYNEDARISDLRHYISDHQFASGGTSESKRVSTKFSYDRGLLSGFGKWKYFFNEDGCLEERHDGAGVEDLFEYDSKGLLRWVERRVAASKNLDHRQRQMPEESFCNGLENACHGGEPGVVKDFALQFVYDAEDRLVVVRNTLNITDLVQYFYGDPQNRNRLTSYYHFGARKAYFLTYEQRSGHLFAVEEVDLSVAADAVKQQKRKTYIVITDGEGSPIAVYNDDKKLLWIAEYSVTGGRRVKNADGSIAQPADSLIVPLGFRGTLMDHHTGFLFPLPTGQAYDQLGATLTCPDWRGAPGWRLSRLHRQPQLLDLHRWGPEHSDWDPLAHLQEASRSSTWWIRSIDADIDRLFPLFQLESGKISPAPTNNDLLLPVECDEGVFVTSRRLQLAARLNKQLETLGIVDMNNLTPNTLLPSWFYDSCPASRVRSVAAIFSNDVNFALSSDGTVSVISVSNSSESHAAKIFLSGAKLMDSWYLPAPLHGGLAYVTSFVQLFVKVTPGIETDLKALHLNRDQLLSVASVRLGGNISPIHGINLSLDSSSGEELRITSANSPGVEWRLRYASGWMEASGRVLREARRRGQEDAWRKAASRTGPKSRGPRTSPRQWPPWTSDSREVEQLAKGDGQVDGYSWEPVIREPSTKTILSELLDDPAVYQLQPTQKDFE